MTNGILLIPLAASFFVTLLFVPTWIKRARRAGLTGRNIHKIEKEEIPEAGGVTVIAGFALGILFFIGINTFFFGTAENFVEIFALMSVILLISFVSFTDDILGWKIGLRRRTRIVLVAFASIPLIAINAGKSSMVLPFLGTTELGLFYPLFLIPLGVVGAATTFNFLAGFNGLEAGQGAIALSALAIVSYFTGSVWLAIIALCMVASLVAFLIFNFYPAKILPGDSLTYAVGGLIAILAILGDFEKIAVFFFIPFILEFFLKARGGFVKESFGRPREDGTLGLRYSKFYGMTHLAIYFLNRMKIEPTEKKVVFSIWIFQILIILVGFAIFGGGIFNAS